MFGWLESEILKMPGSDYLLLFGALVVAAGVLLCLAFLAFKRFRFMAATPTSKIRSAAQGQVELKGLGEWLPNGTITSPFSNSRCIWYHCTIEKRRKVGKTTTWANISDDCSSHLFRLVDDTGHCIIDPDHAHVIPESDQTWYGSNRDDYFRAPGRPRWISLGFGRYRFRERLIRPATSIYALGWFRSFHPDPSGETIERQVEELVRQWKLQPLRYLRQFDLDHDNRLEGDEWKVVRAAAREEVLARINRETEAQHLMSRPQEKNLPFILSAVPEESLVRRKQWKAYSAVAGAFILLVALLLMASVRSPLAV